MTFGKILRWGVHFAHFPLFIFLCAVVRLLGIRQNVVLFSHLTDQFSDNPKYLYLALSESDLASEVELVWVAERRFVARIKEAGVEKVIARRGVAAAWYAARAATYIVSGGLLDVYPFIREKVLLMNVWHGTPLRGIGLDLPGAHKEQQRLKKLHLNHLTFERFDNFISDSRFPNLFAKAFALDQDQVRVQGMARLAGLSKENRALGRSLLGLEVGDVGLLWAPTWRRTREENLHLLNSFLHSELLSPDKSDLRVIVRLHPYANGDAAIKKTLQEFGGIIDAGGLDDVQILLSAADVLVTDYSSIVLDWLHLDRPTYLFRPDISAYRQRFPVWYESLQYVESLADELGQKPLEARVAVSMQGAWPTENEIGMARQLRLIARACEKTR